VKYVQPSAVRQSAAIRLMQRVDAMQVAPRLERVPVPGDPPPGKSALDRQREFEEQRAIVMCLKAKALRQARDGNRNGFVAARRINELSTIQGGDMDIHRSVIQRLVDKGQMRWVNSAHSAAVLVDG
jgi:hypothetical protein